MRRLPTQPRRAAAWSERGFTLIELIIAMVLLALALGLVASVIVQSIGASSGSRAGAMSDSAIVRASNRLADDVAVANTQDRRDNLLRDPADLQASLRTGAPAYNSDPGAPSALLDIDEVVSASPTEVRLRADVDRAAGVECVTWRASNASGYQLRRLVGAACGSGSISNELMLSAPSPVPADIDTSPFAFRLLCNRSLCPNTGAPSGSVCKPWTVSTAAVPANRLRWVIGVDAQLGTVSSARVPASGYGMVRAAVRSRDTETYRRGLGC